MNRKFTHNKKDDTTLEKVGDCIRFTFDGGDEDGPEVHTFKYSQRDLFDMIDAYFEAGQHAKIFDNLTIPAQDALYNALYWLDQRKLEV